MRPKTYTSRDMIAKLVSFDTTSARSNLALIDFATDYLTENGFRLRRTLDDGKEKANLFASIGPEAEGGIVLSGHSDVVPVEGQSWDSDPWTVTERNGRLYGRGTSDMKSFLAIALALAPEMAKMDLARPIHLALSYDEELGCLGVGRLIDDVTRYLPRPAAVIVGEPTMMRIVNGHKGCYVFETRFVGRAAHSSQPHRGANAIAAAAHFVSFLDKLAAEKRLAADPAAPYDPPYTTFGIGRIDGGTAVNIVAQDCTVFWEFRPLPGDDAAEIEARITGEIESNILPALKAAAPEASVEMRRLAAVPSLHPEADGAAEALARRLTGANETAVVSFGTEGGMFQEAGLSTIVCGPGSIDQAHKPNEFIELEQVSACEDFLRRLILWARDTR